MKLICSIILVLIACSGCAKKSVNTIANTNMRKDTMATVAKADSLNYLALGDSYTIGEAVPAEQSYPYQLAAQMGAKGHPLKEPKIIAVTGWTTDNLIHAIAESGISG